MIIDWKTDRDAKRLIFRDINERVVALKSRGVRRVLDLGGGSGWYANQLRLASPGTDVVVMDIGIVSDRNPDISYVKGTMLALPFRDGAFDAVVAHASLHHVHDGIGEVLRDIDRTLAPGGTFLTAEPGAGNPVNNLARRLLRTTQHDDDEETFEPQFLVDAVGRAFDAEEELYCFYLSYLMPHIVARLGPGVKGAGTALTGFLSRLDARLLSAFPALRGGAGYVCITARKRR